MSDNVTQIQANSFRTAQTTTKEYSQQGCITRPHAAAVSITDSKELADFLRKECATTRQTAATQISDRPDMLEAFHVHQFQHPGFFSHPFQC